MLFCLMGLLAFVVVFFKELKLMAFDESASHLLEFRPKLLHTIWVAIVSIVAVAAFETAGTILVVALMIAPAAAANLLTKRLSTMFVISGILGALTSALGVAISLPMSISPAGPIASMSGLVFLSVVLFAPTQGLVSKWRKRNRQRIELLKAVQQKRLKKVTTDRQ
jgi:manganese/zinc/iron transport system permease protein